MAAARAKDRERASARLGNALVQSTRKVPASCSLYGRVPYLVAPPWPFIACGKLAHERAASRALPSKGIQ